LIRTIISMMLMGAAASSAQIATPPASTLNVSFAQGVSSSGWIDCHVIEGLGILVPVKVNGHETTAYLYGGPSSMDTAAMISLGLIGGDAGGESSGVELEIGNLSVKDFVAANAKLGISARAATPVPLQLGEEIFKKLAVEIDFTHQRIAFRDPAAVTKPKGAMELPVNLVSDEWVVPVAVNGATPALFELELGNVSGPLLVTPQYAAEHNLLEGVRTSQRLSGRFTETVVSVPQLSFAGVRTPAAPIALIPDSEVPSAPIAGGMGLPLLERFDMVIDYSHNRIYATPHKDTGSATFFKDRLGMAIRRADNASVGTVAFVASGSPAAAAGFKVGDNITAINGHAVRSLPLMQVLLAQYTDAGQPISFTMEQGGERKVTAADFF
jgi:PDZ domain